ncbi:hypothetical protein BD626DRAFT_252831 [Schizophyllum amplum]|uniref:PARP catalytic domain-containing protein n=1 Tax=Schizophyllum amplum TaxID=97359 RepID=A0A550CI68_9AGAR|nr:hypothetical protein BD626DRAFT_252831 [Auriculariopsis ampla]
MAASRNQRSSGLPPSPLCEVCGKRPKFTENGTQYPYCSRTCASKQGLNPSACALSSCGATGRTAFGGYCSEQHAAEAVQVGEAQACTTCMRLPRAVADLCTACNRLQDPNTARLLEVAPGSTDFVNLDAHFGSEWGGAGSIPLVQKVYRVVLPADAMRGYHDYQSSRPHEQRIRTFFAQQCICDLGTKSPVLCDFKSCGICMSIKSCFRTFAFGSKYLEGRHEKGIFTYRNPAMADKDATSCTSSPYRVMIACDAVADWSLEKGSVDAIHLPYPEAMVPAYVIMYAT